MSLGGFLYLFDWPPSEAQIILADCRLQTHHIAVAVLPTPSARESAPSLLRESCSEDRPRLAILFVSKVLPRRPSSMNKQGPRKSRGGRIAMPEENRHLANMAWCGDYEAIQEWIEAGNVPVYRGHRPGVLPEIVKTGFLSVLRLLLRSYDWRQWPEEQDEALVASVRLARSDFVDLLLAAGANPEKAEWEDVFWSYDTDLIVSMIKARNDLESMFWQRIPLPKPVMVALRQALKEKPEVEPFYIQGVAEAFEGQWETWKDEILLQAHKFFRIVVWAGADTRREVEIESEYEGTAFPESILGIAIRHGTASELKSLHPERNDLPLIQQALLRQCELDKRKLDVLLACGLELADREDGTSSYLRSAIVNLDFKRTILLAKAGARVPMLTGGDVHSFTNALYHRRKDSPGELSGKEFDFLQELIASRP